MMMWNELGIREECEKDEEGKKVIAMIDLWHELCQEKLGFKIEVALADRHEHPQLREFKGELNTALPQLHEEKGYLIIYMDNPRDVEDAILSHEIGHWVLKLQGFLAVVFIDNRNSNFEIKLNSLCSHRALYKLQRSLGTEPQVEIDKRAQHTVEVCLKTDSENESQDLAKDNALLFADDLLSCSEEIAKELKKILQERLPKAWEFTRVILETATYYDLEDQDKVIRCTTMLARKLKLSKNWKINKEEIGWLKNNFKPRA